MRQSLWLLQQLKLANLKQYLPPTSDATLASVINAHNTFKTGADLASVKSQQYCCMYYVKRRKTPGLELTLATVFVVCSK